MRPISSLSCIVLLFWATLLLPGCAGTGAPRQDIDLVSQGNLEAALARLEQASLEAPNNREYRINYLNARARVIDRLLSDAVSELAVGRFDAGAALYRRVLALDRDSTAAQNGLGVIEQTQRHASLMLEANRLLALNDFVAADEKLAKVLQENPRHVDARALRRRIDEQSGRHQAMPPGLRKSFQQPVTLEFRDTNLKQVLEALSRHSELNFILDKDVPPSLMITVFLRQVTVADALDVILTTNQLKSRTLNDTTLLIYPDTAAKQSEHQDLVVKNFFLANAEAKQVMAMLKTVLKAKNVFADDKLNLLIMRDTPSMIRLADWMVATQDVSEPEVMLEVEVLEIQRSRLQNLGIQWPNQLTLAPLPMNGVTLTLKDLRTLNSSTTGASVPALVINLQNQNSNTNLLANPRIRTHNREKALIKIGDRVPVITTTATSTGFVSENIQYVDVGLKLEVEPTIYPNDEVSIKLALEVSSVTKEITSKAGSVSYQIGGRNASTVLRLKDGETQILGGLINDQDIKSANRFPGLGDLPMVGRIFSSHKDTNDKTELVLAITPRVIRGLVPPSEIPAEFWSGTESNPRLSALRSGVVAISSATNNPDSVPDARPQVANPAFASPIMPMAGSPALPATVTPAVSPAVSSTVSPAEAAVATPVAPAIAATEIATPSTIPVLAWDGQSSTRIGDSFNLVLKLASEQAVSSFPLQINYDPTVFAVVAVQPGSFMLQGGDIPQVSQRVDGKTGMIVMSQIRSGQQGATGKGTLAEISFRALRTESNSLITALPRESPPVVAGTPPQGMAKPAMHNISVNP